MYLPTKPKSRGLRFVVISLLVLVLLLLLAVVLVPYLLPWDKIKTEAEKRFSQAIHHPVTIGAVAFHIFRGVEVCQLKIENCQGFSAQPLLRDEAVVIQYRLLPLLFGRVRVKAVILERPQLLIERAADGKFNFSDMLPAKAKITAASPSLASPASQLPEIPLDVLVSRVSIHQASLTFRDLVKKQTYQIEDLNLNIENLTLAGLTPVKLFLDAKVKALAKTIPLHMQMVWRLQWLKEKLHLEQASLVLPGIDVKAQGTVEQMIGNPRLDIQTEIVLDFKKIFQELIPPAFLTRLPPATQLSGEGKIKAQVQGPVQEIKALQAKVQNQLKLNLQTLGLDIPLTVQGNLAWMQTNLSLQEHLVFPGMRADLRLNLSDSLQQRLLAANLNGTLDLASAMTKLVPAKQAEKIRELQARGTLGLKFKAQGPMSQPEKLSLEGKAEAKNIFLDYQKRPVLEKVLGTLVFSPTSLKVGPFTGKLAGQTFKFSLGATGFDLRQPATLKSETMKAKVHWAAESTLLDLDALFSLMPRTKTNPGAGPPGTALTATVSDLPEPDARKMIPLGMQMDGQAKLGGLRYGKVKLGQITLNTGLKQRGMKNQIQLRGYQGQMQCQNQLNFTQSLLGYDLKAEVKQVEIEALLNDVVDTFVAAKLKKPKLIDALKDKLVGRLSGHMEMNGRGMRTANAKNNLKGQGAFTLADGRIRKFSFQSQLAQWFGNERLGQDIPFEHTVAEFTLANRLVQVNKFVAESGAQGNAGDLRLVAEGGLTLETDFENFKLRPSLNPRAASNLSTEFRQYTEVLKDERGWITIPMRLNGPMSNPDVQPDWDWIKQQFSGYTSRKAKAAADEAGKKVRKFIEKEQGKSDQEIKQDASQEIEKAKEKLKDLKLDNLFK